MDEDQTLRFSLRLPKEVHDRLTASANDRGNSVNAELLRLIDKGLEKEKALEPDKTLVEQLLPPALVWRVNRYMASSGVRSAEEAAKRLIKIALDEKESTKDILEKLDESFKNEKDLRLLARDVIAAHSAVTNIKYGLDYVWFITKNNESGAINKRGKLFYSDDGSEWEYNMGMFHPQGSAPKPATSRWNAPESDLDEEVPF